MMMKAVTRAVRTIFQRCFLSSSIIYRPASPCAFLVRVRVREEAEGAKGAFPRTRTRTRTCTFTRTLLGLMVFSGDIDPHSYASSPHFLVVHLLRVRSRVDE
jgi:hypothetical protein